MLDICLLGTGGMQPLPYRWLTSMMARCDGSNLLIDCGEGTQVALKEKGWSPKPVDVICFTHYHADHISGLPGFLLTMGNAERVEPVLLAGPRGLERLQEEPFCPWIRKTGSLQLPDCRHIAFCHGTHQERDDVFHNYRPPSFASLSSLSRSAWDFLR